MGALGDFLRHVGAESGGKADVVLLGDVFEMWQSPFMKCSSELSSIGCENLDCEYGDSDLGCNETDAKKRMAHILAAHKDAIDLLDAFAAQAGNTLTIVPGNHDAALMLPGVRKMVLDRFRSGRVSVSDTGYWISGDRKIYGDHGHQFDDLNLWKSWPDPTVEARGVKHLRRPWGENMVQRFYNQYEMAFPVVDNFLDEKEGILFAIENAGIVPTADAIGRLLRFLLFQQSLGQFATGLGDGKAPSWNVSETRSKPPAFFADVLLADPATPAIVRRAIEENRLTLAAAEMSDAEVARICDRKAALLAGGTTGISSCPRLSENLGAALRSVLFSPEQIRKDHLKLVARTLYADKRSPDIYVYGHTHRAVPPMKVGLGDLLTGPASTVVVNTGAFQRVGSSEQIVAALAEKRRQKPGATFSDVTPDNLPDCHTFVSVAPYTGTPAAALRHIVARADGPGRRVGDGVCPGN
jgi:predicted phosphodiesterase